MIVRTLVYHYCRGIPIRLGKTKLISASRGLVTPYEGEAQLKAGGKLVADLSDLVPRLLYFLGYYELGLTELISCTLRPGDTFIDVGAHIGYYTVLASGLVGPDGEVHSFEPVPDIFSRLETNAALNNLENARLNQTAVSDRDGDLEIYLPRAINTGTGSFVKQPNSSDESRVCRSVSLDSYVQSNGIGDIRLIKMDVEGAEVLALGGMHGVLEAVDPPNVICEAVPLLLEAAGSSVQELVSLMEEKGFHASRITDRGPVALQLGEQPDYSAGWNLYFTRGG